MDAPFFVSLSGETRRAFEGAALYEQLADIIDQLSTAPAVDEIVSDRLAEAAAALQEARRRLSDVIK